MPYSVCCKREEPGRPECQPNRHLFLESSVSYILIIYIPGHSTNRSMADIKRWLWMKGFLALLPQGSVSMEDSLFFSHSHFLIYENNRNVNMYALALFRRSNEKASSMWEMPNECFLKHYCYPWLCSSNTDFGGTGLRNSISSLHITLHM